MRINEINEQATHRIRTLAFYGECKVIPIMLVALGLTLDIHHHLVISECLVHDLFHALHQVI